jgi:4-aminobutyrate aminotransferase-like enzyme
VDCGLHGNVFRLLPLTAGDEALERGFDLLEEPLAEGPALAADRAS